MMRTFLLFGLLVAAYASSSSNAPQEYIAARSALPSNMRFAKGKAAQTALTPSNGEYDAQAMAGWQGQYQALYSGWASNTAGDVFLAATAKGSSNAILKFSDTPVTPCTFLSCPKNNYEIVFGSRGNTGIDIYRNGVLVKSLNQSSVFPASSNASSPQQLGFWARVYQNEVDVGLGAYGIGKVLSFVDSSPFAVQYCDLTSAALPVIYTSISFGRTAVTSYTAPGSFSNVNSDIWVFPDPTDIWLSFLCSAAPSVQFTNSSTGATLSILFSTNSVTYTSGGSVSQIIAPSAATTFAPATSYWIRFYHGQLRFGTAAQTNTNQASSAYISPPGTVTGFSSFDLSGAGLVYSNISWASLGQPSSYKITEPVANYLGLNPSWCVQPTPNNPSSVFFLTGTVNGTTDLSILLTPYLETVMSGETNPAYEILLGGAVNSVSLIRKYSQDPNQPSRLNGINNAVFPAGGVFPKGGGSVKFWVWIANGYIAAGVGAGLLQSPPIVNYVDPSPMPVACFDLATWSNDPHTYTNLHWGPKPW